MLAGAASEEALKSQRPSRRKQALQVTTPLMCPSSAFQPNKAKSIAGESKAEGGAEPAAGSEAGSLGGLVCGG